MPAPEFCAGCVANSPRTGPTTPSSATRGINAPVVSEQFSPRTVAIVALASLVGGFVTVFGGGMLALRPRSRVEIAPETSPSPTPPIADNPDGGSETTPSPADPDSAATAPPSGDDGGAAVTAAGVTITPSGASRCWDQNNPAIIPGPRCDRLAGLDQHFLARAAQIAACGQGHGRLAFIMDFRFSTQFVRAWGGPTSTIPNAGTVSACVRRVTAPLPLAQVQHAHDRYIVTVPIEW